MFNVGESLSSVIVRVSVVLQRTVGDSVRENSVASEMNM